MRQTTFALVASLVFFLVALMHALRLAFGWDVALNGWKVPMWLSWAAMGFALYLAFTGFRLARKG